VFEVGLKTCSVVRCGCSTELLVVGAEGRLCDFLEKNRGCVVAGQVDSRKSVCGELLEICSVNSVVTDPTRIVGRREEICMLDLA